MSATATVGTHAAVTTRMAGSPLGALAGLVFSLCFFMGIAMLDVPRGVTDREMVAWWSDNGNRDHHGRLDVLLRHRRASAFSSSWPSFGLVC